MIFYTINLVRLRTLYYKRHTLHYYFKLTSLKIQKGLKYVDSFPKSGHIFTNKNVSLKYL